VVLKKDEAERLHRWVRKRDRGSKSALTPTSILNERHLSQALRGNKENSHRSMRGGKKASSMGEVLNTTNMAMSVAERSKVNAGHLRKGGRGERN